MRLTVAIAIGCLVALAAQGPARAGLIATENFESYTVGDLVESGSGVGLSGGTGWTAAWNIADAYRTNVTIQAGSLSYTSPSGAINVSGGSQAMRLANVNATNSNFVMSSRNFESQADTLYYSFLIRQDAASASDTTGDFIQIGPGTTWEAPTISVGVTAGPDFFARVGTPSGQQSLTGTARPIQNTYLVVAKISKVAGATNYNRTDLWVNPDSLTEPTVSTYYYNTSYNSGRSAFTTLLTRLAFLETSDVFYLDNYAVGTTYGSVVPEPATLALLGLGAIALVAGRKKRQRI